MSKEFKYGIDHLTPNLALQIANREIRGIFTEEVKSKVIKNYETVQKIAKGKKLVYSINTGVGSLCTT
ncbi:MAG: histidine ammonia-lyase, partial [Candidatus Lokiarchaeota archaeon]|nr:histidine ammonia-lyase [Candidatus Lokiarchaeota archaeon]